VCVCVCVCVCVPTIRDVENLPLLHLHQQYCGEGSQIRLLLQILNC
jgi:hypothetical protein